MTCSSNVMAFVLKIGSNSTAKQTLKQCGSDAST